MMPHRGSAAASELTAVKLFFGTEENPVLRAGVVSSAADTCVEYAVGLDGDGSAGSDLLLWDVVACSSQANFDE